MLSHLMRPRERWARRRRGREHRWRVRRLWPILEGVPHGRLARPLDRVSAARGRGRRSRA